MRRHSVDGFTPMHPRESMATSARHADCPASPIRPTLPEPQATSISGSAQEHVIPSTDSGTSPGLSHPVLNGGFQCHSSSTDHSITRLVPSERP